MGWDVVAICLGLFIWEVGAALVFLRLERGDGVNSVGLFIWPGRAGRGRPSAGRVCAPAP